MQNLKLKLTSNNNAIYYYNIIGSLISRTKKKIEIEYFLNLLTGYLYIIVINHEMMTSPGSMSKLAVQSTHCLTITLLLHAPALLFLVYVCVDCIQRTVKNKTNPKGKTKSYKVNITSILSTYKTTTAKANWIFFINTYYIIHKSSNFTKHTTCTIVIYMCYEHPVLSFINEILNDQLWNVHTVNQLHEMESHITSITIRNIQH